MIERKSLLFREQHSHVFLGAGHSRAERQAWAVIWLCGLMMAVEVVGGILFGSVALIAVARPRVAFAAQPALEATPPSRD